MDIKYVTVDKIGVVYACASEAETTITVTREDTELSIYCSDNVMLTKIKKAMAKNPENWKCWEAGRDSEGKLKGYFFTAPKKSLSLRGGNKKEITEEARQAARERFAGCKRGRKKKVEA